MNFLICLLSAIASFVAFFALVMGLISAPTPVLVTILIAGLILTQKSINKFSEPQINLKNQNTNNIEKIASDFSEVKTIVVLPESEEELKLQPINTHKSLTYRGFNYNKNDKREKSKQQKTSSIFTYRGLTVSTSNKFTDLS